MRQRASAGFAAVRRISARLGLAAAALFALAGFVWMGSGTAARAYMTTPATVGPLAATVNATGTLRPTKTVEIGSPVSGRVDSIEVDWNSTVTAGEVIARIDAATYRVQVKQAEANVATAKASLRRSQGEYDLRARQLERSRSLLSQKVIPRDQFEAARAAVVQAEAQLAIDTAGVEVAEARLEDARVNLTYTEIVSPIDGIVLSRNVNVGQTVAASFQTPTLFVIADDLTQMQLEVSVSEADIGAVREGQAARFTVDTFPDRRFEGVVEQVRNAARTVQNVVTYDVVVAVQNRDLTLRPGMTANVTIVTAERRDALKVPLRALRFRPDEEVLARVDAAPRSSREARLWIAKGGSDVEPVTVKLGITGDEEVEISGGGIRQGDAVVIGYARSDDAP